MDTIDKKTICSLISHTTELVKLVDELKKTNSNSPELRGGIRKIDEGIADIKLCIGNSLGTRTRNQSKMSQMEPLNLPETTKSKASRDISPISPRSGKTSPRISIITRVVSPIENLPLIKRRNTDCIIRYRK
jgi:hypothetical protein